MQRYQSHKLVNACPMTRGEYNKLRGWEVPENENPDDAGFLVEYLDSPNKVHPDFDNYISWSPEEVFDQGYTHKPSHTQGAFLVRYLQDMCLEVGRVRDELTAKVNELNSKLVIDQTDEEKEEINKLSAVYFYLRTHYGAMSNAVVQLANLDSTIDLSQVNVFELDKVPYPVIQSLQSQLTYRFYRVHNSNITACHAFLPNNFKVGYGESGCLNDADFNQATGEKIARERAEADAVNNLWFAEGYARAMRLI